MPEQYPRPLAHRVAIRHSGAENRAIQQASVAEQLRELYRVRPIHRLDRIAVVGIAEGYRDEEKPARRHQVEAVSGQPVGVDHVLEKVTAQQCTWTKRAQ